MPARGKRAPADTAPPPPKRAGARRRAPPLPPTPMAARAPPRLGDASLIDRTELVRLLAQCLQDLGHGGVAASLEAESGTRAEPPAAARVRAAVAAGAWGEVPGLMEGLGVGGEGRKRVAWVAGREACLEVRG